MPKFSHPQDLPLVQVVDSKDAPLLWMPIAAVLRQQLNYRLALTAIITPDHRLIMGKRRCGVLPHQGLWDLFTTPVYQGEAREDAACRRVAHDTDILLEYVEARGTHPASSEAPAWATLFAAKMPAIHHTILLQSHAHLMLVDQDEVSGLTVTAPELFTPEALWAVSLPTLFPTKKQLQLI